MRLGQLDIPTLFSELPPGMLTLALATPVGTALIDPLATAQNSATQAILNALGISLTLYVGDVPADVQAAAAATPLSQGLQTAGWIALGLVGLVLAPRLLRRTSTATNPPRIRRRRR